MKCNKCGNELKDGDLFCGNCGNKIILKKENENNNKISIDIKSIIIIIIIIGVLILVVKFISSSNDRTVSKTNADAGRLYNEYVNQGNNYSKETITTEKFNKIQNGMTYNQVCEIMGFQGELSSEYGTSQYGITRIYLWSDSNLNTIGVTFVDGKVSGKTKM
ncbi:MAG: zinc ribbon domain-containing protein [Clostridia bacterium]|nr:zinc ribbon domain-containing protein [Clostridia bacterium]